MPKTRFTNLDTELSERISLDAYTVSTEIAQLALSIQKGDICKRTDSGKVYQNITGSNTTMSDWLELGEPDIRQGLQVQIDALSSSTAIGVVGEASSRTAADLLLQDQINGLSSSTADDLIQLQSTINDTIQTQIDALSSSTQESFSNLSSDSMKIPVTQNSHGSSVGQKVSLDGVVSTYFQLTSRFIGGVLAPDGSIHCISYTAPVGQKITTLSAIPFSQTICQSPFLNKF